MSIQLPSELAWVLNLLGFMWPEADEDKLRACAQAWRDFGTDVVRINQDARLVAARVTAENSGDSIDSFDRYWHGVGGSGGDFDRAKEAAENMGMALDVAAKLVEGVKLGIITQLGLLAAEIVVDQVAAPETLGLSEGVMVGEVILTRGIVRRIIQEGIHKVTQEIVHGLKGHVMDLFRKILATAVRRAVVGATAATGMDVAKQEADIHIFHSRTHLDLSEVAGATGTGAVLGVISAPGRPKRRSEVRGPYKFSIDGKNRPTKVEGWLVLDPAQGRDHAAQLAAGRPDRLDTDVGGHLIGRQFQGPTEDFNLIAQDGQFNNSAYKKLEYEWSSKLKAGNEIYVVIEPKYEGGSLRPFQLDIVYTVDGQPVDVTFMNRPGGI